MFREAILAFLGVKTDKDIEDDYCKVCKQAKPDVDCSTCDKKIEMVGKKEGRTIGSKK